MDVVERLTLEAASGDTLVVCEHRHRYELARDLCGELRVLDLCCGSGYGSDLLARAALEVVGVDNDVATIDRARVTVGLNEGVSFEAADAVAYLARPLAERFDAIVCFEGIEHLRDHERVLRLLRGHAEDGVKLIVSIPNSKLFAEVNPFHLTDFGYEEAVAAFADFPAPTMLAQFLAEGSVICPPGATDTDAVLVLEDRREPAYANHFIFCVNFDAAALNAFHRGRMMLEAAPLYNRYMRGLERANTELRRANARLARNRLPVTGSAAASYVIKLEARAAHAEAALEEWRRRALAAENGAP